MFYLISYNITFDIILQLFIYNNKVAKNSRLLQWQCTKGALIQYDSQKNYES